MSAAQMDEQLVVGHVGDLHTVLRHAPRPVVGRVRAPIRSKEDGIAAWRLPALDRDGHQRPPSSRNGKECNGREAELGRTASDQAGQFCVVEQIQASFRCGQRQIVAVAYDFPELRVRQRKFCRQRSDARDQHRIGSGDPPARERDIVIEIPGDGRQWDRREQRILILNGGPGAQRRCFCQELVVDLRDFAGIENSVVCSCAAWASAAAVAVDLPAVVAEMLAYC